MPEKTRQVAMGTDTPPAETNRRRQWVLFVGVLLLLLGASAEAGKYWIIPANARRQFRSTVLHYWGGKLEIDRMEGGYFSPIRALGVTLRDARGRVWLRADSVTLTYTPLPSISEKLRVASIDGLELTLHVDDGQCRPPVRNVPDFIRWLEEQFSIERFTISRGTVAIRCDGKPSGLWDDFAFDCRREQGTERYTLELTRPGPAGLSGSRCGSIGAAVTANWPNGGRVAYDGTLTLKGFKPADLLTAVGQGHLAAGELALLPAAGGDVSLQYAFSGVGLLGPETVKGHGRLRVDRQSGGASAGKVEFAVQGTIVRIKEVLFTVPKWCFHGTEAGWLDLASGKIDLSLTGKPQGGLMAKIPLLQKLVTVPIHVTGRWDVPGKLNVENTRQD